MKIRYLLLVAVFFFGFSTGSYASKKDLDSSFNVEKNDRSNEKHFSDGGHEHHGHGDRDDHHAIVKFDFDDELRHFAENHHEKQNVYLCLNKKEGEHDEHHGHVDSGATPPVNEVPLPAALWLFGSSILGLLGARYRKIG